MGTLKVRVLGANQAYEPIWQRMRDFTAQRSTETPDELWLLEHQPVFTLGRNGKREHVLAPGAIPVLAIDRGGQVTYHGPGQLVAYLLADLRRKQLGVRETVERLERSVIQWLKQYQIAAQGNREAPGVYVDGKKISALGLRISRGCSYHGLSLNVAMDLEPFTRINPCGYAGLAVTQCADLGIQACVMEVAGELASCFAEQLGYSLLEWQADDIEPVPAMPTSAVATSV